MEITIPEQLSALAHPKRLDLFRLLIRHYPSPMAAGEIARTLSLKANTASSYLTALHRAGLIHRHRVATSVQYSAKMGNIRALLAGLMSECCQSRPDLCQPPGEAGQRPTALHDTGQPVHVLFLCTGNSARSVLAEAILRDFGEGRFIGFSAGTKPKSAPHPDVLRFLRRKGHDTSDLTSKSLAVFDAAHGPQMDLIITVCDAAASEECPLWPGHPISAHWGQPDPVGLGQGDTAICDAYNLLLQRINALIAMPLHGMSLIDIQLGLDDIGRICGEPAKGT